MKTLRKTLRDGRTAIITLTQDTFRVEVDGAPFGGPGRIEKLPKKRSGATYVIRCEGAPGLIGLDDDQAAVLGYGRPSIAHMRQPRGRRCSECGGPLNPHGDAPGLQAVNGTCYDCV